MMETADLEEGGAAEADDGLNWLRFEVYFETYWKNDGPIVMARYIEDITRAGGLAVDHTVANGFFLMQAHRRQTFDLLRVLRAALAARWARGFSGPGSCCP